MQTNKIVAVPDLHFPYHSAALVERTIDLIKEIQPTTVVALGDQVDLYCFSRYGRDLNFIKPADELLDALVCLQSFWKAVQWAAPEAKCVALMGNHEGRIRKQMREKWPEGETLLAALDVNQLWRCDGVELVTDHRVPYDLGDDIVAVHGDFLRTSKLGERVKYLRRNVVYGHTHTAGVSYLPLHNATLWELACGTLADSTQLPLQYGPISQTPCVQGIGLIDEWGPRFIAMQ